MSNALTMAGRSLRLSARSPEALLTALLLPVMLMVVFVYLFGGAVDIGTSYVDYVVPGVLLLCAVTGASTTAVTVCQDMAGGIIDRFRSLDVPGTTMLAGHVTASLLRNLASTVLVTAVAFGIGFRPHSSVARFAAALGVLLLFVAAVSWLAAAFGLLVSAPEAANSAMFFLMFFCYASSAFVPVRTMPWWLRGFAHQPATSVTETIRGLLLRQPGGLPLGTALAWCGGILAISIAVSAWLFRRRTAVPRRGPDPRPRESRAELSRSSPRRLQALSGRRPSRSPASGRCPAARAGRAGTFRRGLAGDAAGRRHGTPSHLAPRRGRPCSTRTRNVAVEAAAMIAAQGGRGAGGRALRLWRGRPRPGLPADGAPGRGDDPAPAAADDAYAAARGGLAHRLGEVLARIHQVDPDSIPGLPAPRRAGPGDGAVRGLRRAPARARDRPALARRAPARSGRGRAGPR